MLKKKKYQNQRKRRKKTGDFKDDFSLIIFDYFWEKKLFTKLALVRQKISKTSQNRYRSTSLLILYPQKIFGVDRATFV
jgi:hypothetical protein